MDRLVITYVLYLAICIPMALVVGSTLFRNGRVFVVDVFAEREDIADSVNHLLLVGFYLLTIGFVSLFTRAGGAPGDQAEVVAWLSTKVGAVLIVLGIVHMFNVVVFTSLRKRLRATEDDDFGTPRTPPGTDWREEWT